MKIDEKIKNLPCDTEPIHLINDLQEFGALLVIEFTDHKIIAASDNIHLFLTIDPLELIGKTTEERIAELEIPWDGLSEKLTETKTGCFRFTKLLYEKKFFFTLRKSENFLLVEIEIDDSHFQKDILLSNNQEVFSNIAQNTLNQIYQSAVESIQKITEFDRVVLYHFFPDYSGEVLAESKLEKMESILGYHYPSTDIPLPARNLYAKTPIRFINIKPKTKVKLIRIPEYTNYSFHLGETLLRAPHSHHIEYLTNMGISTSMSISIVCEGKLWGLFICHASDTRIPTPSLRKALEVYSTFISMQIDLFIRNQKVTYALELELSLSRILKKITQETVSNVHSIFRQEAEHLRTLLKSDGFFFHCVGEIGKFGELPSETTISKVLSFLETNYPDQIFMTNELGAYIKDPSEELLKFPGIISFPLSTDIRDRLVWFRKELVRTIDWAGNPKETFTRNTKQVSPRTSFGKFIETIKGKSQSFSPAKKIALESFLSVREIIDKKRIEAELALTLSKVIQSEKELFRLNQTKDKFFSIISHNLRSPFASLLGLSEILLESIPSDEILDRSKIKNLASNLNYSSYKAFELLKNLFEWGKIQQGKISINKQKHLFSEIMNEAIYNLSVKINRKNINLNLKCDEELQVEVDSNIIVEILTHLLSNAIKFSNRNSEVNCFVNVDENCIHIMIEDHGIGISETDLSKLFQIDSKFRNYGTEKEDGTGLGLIIVKEYINFIKGEISIQSELNIGTKVMISFSRN